MTAALTLWSRFRGIAAARYGVAAAAVGATYLLRLAADAIVGSSAPFILFILPVFFTILVAGRGPGIFAGMLSLVAGLTLLSPTERFSSETLLQTGMFIFVCAGISWLDSRRATQRAVAKQANRLLDLMLEGASALFYRLVYGAHSVKSLERNILKFVGIRGIERMILGGVEADEDRRLDWLDQMRALGTDGA